uniref:SEC12 1 n=1 Tax=Solanum tuberosum TaxID=4113 RepID=M1BNC3_SOLTU
MLVGRRLHYRLGKEGLDPRTQTTDHGLTYRPWLVPPKYGTQRDGVPITLSRNADENIELCRGSKYGDVCVIDVTKMEISSLHKRLHLGTNITSLEFCPSERYVKF